LRANPLSADGASCGHDDVRQLHVYRVLQLLPHHGLAGLPVVLHLCAVIFLYIVFIVTYYYSHIVTVVLHLCAVIFLCIVFIGMHMMWLMCGNLSDTEAARASRASRRRMLKLKGSVTEA
jgi:hypothetical protein